MLNRKGLAAAVCTLPIMLAACSGNNEESAPTTSSHHATTTTSHHATSSAAPSSTSEPRAPQSHAPESHSQPAHPVEPQHEQRGGQSSAPSTTPAREIEDDDPNGKPCEDQSGAPGHYIPAGQDGSDGWVCEITENAPRR